MKYKHNCKSCNKEYINKKKESTYCSNFCKNLSFKKNPDRYCEICGNKTRCHKVNTCSKKCLKKWHLLKKDTIEWKTRDSIEIINCNFCFKEIEKLKSDNIKKYCSKDCLNNWKIKNYKGRKLTKEWLENQNKSKTKENLIKFGEFNCNKCNKNFDNNLSLRAHRSYCSKNDEQKNVNCDFCNKVFKRSRNLEVHLKLKHDLEKNLQHRKNVSIACQKRETQKTSKEEIEFFNTLKLYYGENNVLHKFKVNGINHEFDFYVIDKNLIIELDGDYWHGNKENQILTNRMKIQYHIDKGYTESAILAGFEIIRVWTSKKHLFPNQLREI